MTVAPLIGALATAWWAIATGVHLAAVTAPFLQPRLRRRAATRNDQPGVSIVIPVKAVEPELERAFASAFGQGYPDLEVIITAAEHDSPALAIAREVAARFPRVACRFVLGNARVTRNPKVSNLAPAIAAARHGLVLIKDANIQLGDGQLAAFVRELTPGTGMVCAIPIAVRPQTFCAAVESAEMNGRSAPLLMGASVLRLDVGFGKTMLIERGLFDRVDGLAVMAPTFGDDHALAKALRRVGLRTVFAAGVIHQAMGRRACRAVWERQLRWMVIRRDEAPLVFFGEIFFGGVAATLAGCLGFAGLGWPAWIAAVATPLLWLASETVVVVVKGWGWSWRYPLAAVGREVMLVALWLRAWFSRKVQWAGQPFALGDEPRR